MRALQGLLADSIWTQSLVGTTQVSLGQAH